MQYVCKMCGKIGESPGANRKYCDECAALRKKAQDHNHWARLHRAVLAKRREHDPTKEEIRIIEDDIQLHIGLEGFDDIFDEWKFNYKQLYKKMFKDRFEKIRNKENKK